MIADIHGSRYCSEFELRELKKFQPNAVCLEMLPLGKKFLLLCEKLSQGSIDVFEFVRRTGWENHWGPYEGYLPLLGFLHDSKIIIYPIDCSLKKRYEIARLEKKIIEEFNKKRNVTLLLDRDYLTLYLEREKIFAKNILRLIRDKNPEKIAVLVGSSHVERLASFFKSLSFEVEVKFPAEGEKLKMREEYEKIQSEFVKTHNVLNSKKLPLVPINYLRVNLVTKFLRNQGKYRISR